MAIIVNSKLLPPNATKDSELFNFVKEYQDGVTALKTRFPYGTIQLKRAGYPKVNKSPDGKTYLPEIAPPIFIKYTRTVGGNTWAYCPGRPLIHANGLVDVPENDNSESIRGEMLTLDVNTKPDYTFYIWFKSGLIGTEFTIYEPEADKIKELTEKNANLKVQSSIRDMEEEKLRMVCGAWGIKNASTKNILLLQEEIENKVFAMEQLKRNNPTDLMAKGVSEFLAEIRNDEITRPKAVIQLALDEGRLTFSQRPSKFLFDEAEVCHVPLDKQSMKMEFLAQFLRHPDNRDAWLSILNTLITEEYINGLDRYGVRWLAGQLGIPLNQKPEELMKALLEQVSA